MRITTECHKTPMNYVLCICITHWESTSCVMYYVLRITYCVLRTATGSQHRLLCIMYYVLCVLCTTHWESTSSVLYYVLRIMYYVLRTGTWESTSYVMYYVLYRRDWGAAPASSFLERAQRADRIEKVGLVLTRSVISPEIYVTRRPPASSAVASAHTTLANLWQP